MLRVKLTKSAIADPRRSARAGYSSMALALLASLSIACATTTPIVEPTAGSDGAGDEPVVAEAPSETDAEDADSVFTSTAEDETAEAEDGVVEDLSKPKSDADTQAQNQPGSGGLAQRAESAVEGVIIGTVVGGQIAGGYGAAVGAALFGLYGLITGDVPFDSGPNTRRTGPGGGDADEALEAEIEEELEKQSALEDEIEQELRRQEELLAKIDQQEGINAEIEKEKERRVALEQSDPTEAPPVPYLREIPESIFESEERTIGGESKVVKTLDADRDGQPEMEKIYNESTGALDRVAQDTNYDGQMDTQFEYDEKGEVRATIEDTDFDGKPDRWATFADGRGTRVEVDRDSDGVRDAFQVFEGDSLAYEEFDDDNDGVINRRVEYKNRSRAVEKEDRDANGQVDFWTYYEAGGRPTRIEKDTKGDGKPDVWEYYEGADPGSMLIVRKEEDMNGDGEVDVTSYYEAGRLSRKEIQNAEALNGN